MALASKPTQEFVPIKEIRDGVVILKDTGLRAVLMASSVNFALKSEENQQAIILQFQNFLNSLDFSAQIVVQSRKLDVKPYLNLLESRFKAQTDELMKTQIREYVNFVKSFVESSDIMEKTFFVVVPYARAILKGAENIGSSLVGGKKAAAAEDSADQFEESKNQLEQRVAVVEQGLVRCGVRVARLGTEEIVELFYKTFNPGETGKPMSPQ